MSDSPNQEDLPQVTVTVLGESAASCDDVVAMFVDASHDAHLCAATYLPAVMDAGQARRFCAESEGWVIRANGAAAGVLLVHHVPRPGEGVELPSGCVEIERWLLARYRGKGLLRRAWPQLTAKLARRFRHLAAVCWEQNHEARQSLRACGFEHLGRSFWADETCSGWCEVYLYHLQSTF
jgi:RimJ/RimL family protein N-acetyltransferase